MGSSLSLLLLSIFLCFFEGSLLSLLLSFMFMSLLPLLPPLPLLPLLPFGRPEAAAGRAVALGDELPAAPNPFRGESPEPALVIRGT